MAAEMESEGELLHEDIQERRLRQAEGLTGGGDLEIMAAANRF